MTQMKYNDPEMDVRIDSAYRGDIRCRKLVIEKTGSVVGNIEAFDVRNFGRIQGVVNASDVFINSENAVARGSVYAPHIGNHPRSTLEGALSNSRPFQTDHAAATTPSELERAIDLGIRRELERAGLASEAMGLEVSANSTFAHSASASAPTTFRTPDGVERPIPAEIAKAPDGLLFAPPAPTRKEFVAGKEYTVVTVPGEAKPTETPSATTALRRADTPAPVQSQRRPLPPLFNSAI